MQNCSDFTTCGTCSAVSGCAWCFRPGASDPHLAPSGVRCGRVDDSCPGSIATMPRQCGCEYRDGLGCTGCVSLFGGSTCSYCNSTETCSPITGGDWCPVYSWQRPQCTGDAPGSNSAACKVFGDCLECSSAQSGCRWCNNNSRCLDPASQLQCPGAAFQVCRPGAGGSSSASSIPGIVGGVLGPFFVACCAVAVWHRGRLPLLHWAPLSKPQNVSPAEWVNSPLESGPAPIVVRLAMQIVNKPKGRAHPPPRGLNYR
jgi:hypothetical protein